MFFSLWLPRTRGDRPVIPNPSTTVAPAPPHTRGSTVRALRAAIRAEGSPAHAGIDPCLLCPAEAGPGLPRTRGDRPLDGLNISCAIMAPPHTRGSTSTACAPSLSAAGSPAHAGIDLRRCMSCSWRRWLPRTRGDRPLAGPGVYFSNAAPPHTRGSTLTGSIRRLKGAGSPAHAGIDLNSTDLRRYNERLPRTRGDRPLDGLNISCAIMAPPHTRGSTLQRNIGWTTLTGSPAHAGIDLSARSGIRLHIWLPRTRGDRPLPRLLLDRDSRAPPHTRGSTFGRADLTASAWGSPAHAGIDLFSGLI